jgi:hypothetical protein
MKCRRAQISGQGQKASIFLDYDCWSLNRGATQIADVFFGGRPARVNHREILLQPYRVGRSILGKSTGGAAQKARSAPGYTLRPRWAGSGVWTFWRDGRWAVSRTIFHRAGDAPRGVSPIAPLRGAQRAIGAPCRSFGAAQPAGRGLEANQIFAARKEFNG